MVRRRDMLENRSVSTSGHSSEVAATKVEGSTRETPEAPRGFMDLCTSQLNRHFISFIFFIVLGSFKKKIET